MPGQQLMSTFVGDNGFQRKVLRIGIALEGLRINKQYVFRRRIGEAELGPAGLAAKVSVFEAANEAESPADFRNPSLPGK